MESGRVYSAVGIVSILCLVGSAAGLPVPVAIVSNEDGFDSDTVAAGEWVLQRYGGDYSVADSELRLFSEEPVNQIVGVQVAKVAVLDPFGTTLEANVRTTQHGFFEMAFWTPMGGVNLAATGFVFALYSTDVAGAVIEAQYVPLSWPTETAVTMRLSLFPLEGRASAELLDGNGSLLGAAAIEELWFEHAINVGLDLGLEVTYGIQAWSPPGYPAADYFTDQVRLQSVLPVPPT